MKNEKLKILKTKMLNKLIDYADFVLMVPMYLIIMVSIIYFAFVLLITLSFTRLWGSIRKKKTENKFWEYYLDKILAVSEHLLDF